MKNYYKQKGFGLIAIIVAVVIILIIAFGIGSWQGQIERNKQIENRAAENLKNINKNLEKYNQEIQDTIIEN